MFANERADKPLESTEPHLSNGSCTILVALFILEISSFPPFLVLDFMHLWPKIWTLCVYGREEIDLMHLCPKIFDDFAEI